MYVLGHHHVSHDRELVALAHVVENDEKHIARASGSQEWQAPVATEGDEMKVRGAVAAFQVLWHEQISNRKGLRRKHREKTTPLCKTRKEWGTRKF
jgi:hypothetical protein